MGISLAFHIVFAAAGVALPALMVIADVAHRRTRDPEYLLLSKRLAKGTASCSRSAPSRGRCCRSSSACSGRASWARFGESIGLPFALEGSRSSRRRSSSASTCTGAARCRRGCTWRRASPSRSAARRRRFFVLVTLLTAAFMNGPPGGTDPIAAMCQPVLVAPGRARACSSCYQATALAMVAIHAFILLRDPTRTLHRKALALALPMACVDRAGAAAVGGLFGQAPRRRAAAEARCGGGPPAHGRARGAARRRHPGSGDRRVPRRAADPRRPVVPGVRRLRRDRHRAGCVPARRTGRRCWRCAARSR